jgi:hypothetical protein
MFVGGDAVLSAKVNKEDGRPDHLQHGIAASSTIFIRRLVVIEERGEGVYRHSIAANVCQPHYESNPPREGSPTPKGKDIEKELDGQAAENEDTQLPLLPPVHSTSKNC